MTATARTLKSCVVVQIILNIVTIVKVVADYFSICSHDQEAAIRIVFAIPFLSRCHAQCYIK